MRSVFTFTLFISSALLFLVEPMMGKMVLPIFGGAPAVWGASMVFFQGALLLGYGYAHLSTRWFGRRQPLVHLVLMLAAMWTLPIVVPKVLETSSAPAFQLLGLLALTVGPVFFMLAAGAPLIQKWFASTKDPDAKDPYFLYSASNLGSMVALLAYPLIVEPNLRLSQQSQNWAWAYRILILLMVVCAGWLLRSNGAAAVEEAEAAPVPAPSSRTRGEWVLLGAVPSSLLLGVTSYLTANVAPIPLLWVVPLALYLLTFILAFAKRQVVTPEILGRILPLIIVPLALAMVLESTSPIIPLGILHLAVFFVAAWMCHARLSRSRPDPTHLTEFYFWIALGGVVGGIFNALVAPYVFSSYAEYPIALVLACLLRPARIDFARNRIDWAYPLAVGLLTIGAILGWKYAAAPIGPWRTVVTVGVPIILCFLAVDRPLRFGLALGAFFLASSVFHSAASGEVILSARSFFGVHRVVVEGLGNFHKLIHGNTIHGMQDLRSPSEPLTYYHRESPIGQVFKYYSGPRAKHDIALVGLGVGSLAAYGEPGEHITFYEIDPVVKQIATDPQYFTYLRDSKADVQISLGDARLTLSEAPDSKYGLIVLDAFSSDAIPMHLLTEEAIKMYLSKLQPDGVLAFHISNRYLNLQPVLAAAAKDLALDALYQEEDDLSQDDKDHGKTPSHWVIMARNPSVLSGFLTTARWSQIEADPGVHAWTDDYSNILSAWAPRD